MRKNNGGMIIFTCEEEEILADLGRRSLISESLDYEHFQIGKGNATIGGVVIGKTFVFAVSLCSPEDFFKKKLGCENVRFNMIHSSQGNKRGILEKTCIPYPIKPSLLLKMALEKFLKRKRGIPSWAKGQKVNFRKANQ